MINDVEELAVLTTKRAYEKMMVKLGREPSESEVILFVTQCQLAAMGSLLLTSDSELLQYWQLTHAIVTNGASRGNS